MSIKNDSLFDYIKNKRFRCERIFIRFFTWPVTLILYRVVAPPSGVWLVTCPSPNLWCNLCRGLFHLLHNVCCAEFVCDKMQKCKTFMEITTHLVETTLLVVLCRGCAPLLGDLWRRRPTPSWKHTGSSRVCVYTGRTWCHMYHLTLVDACVTSVYHLYRKCLISSSWFKPFGCMVCNVCI